MQSQDIVIIESEMDDQSSTDIDIANTNNDNNVMIVESIENGSSSNVDSTTVCLAPNLAKTVSQTIAKGFANAFKKMYSVGDDAVNYIDDQLLVDQFLQIQDLEPSYHIIEDPRYIINDTLCSKIGRGAYGNVYIGYNLFDGECYAIKESKLALFEVDEKEIMKRASKITIRKIMDDVDQTESDFNDLTIGSEDDDDSVFSYESDSTSSNSDSDAGSDYSTDTDVDESDRIDAPSLDFVDWEDATAEIKVMTTLQSVAEANNLLPLVDWTVTPISIQTVSPLCYSDLFEFVGDHPELVNPKIIGRQLLTAIACMHEHGFIHRDIKPENCLVTEVPENPESIQIRLADFGVTASVDPETQRIESDSTYASRCYESPELKLGCGYYDAAYDIWAFGMTMLFLLVGDVPLEPKYPDGATGKKGEENRAMLNINEHTCYLLGQIELFGWPDRDYRSEFYKLDSYPAFVHEARTIGFGKDKLKKMSGANLGAIFASYCEHQGEKFGDEGIVDAKLGCAMISKALKWNPADRPSAQELLDNVWFK